MRISDWSSDVCSSDLDVVDDVLAVELRERQLDRIRTRGEHHVGGLELDLGAVVLLYLDHVAGLQLAEAMERRDLVGLEQHRDAAGELLHDGVLAEIGSASCRERGCQDVSISVVAVSLKKKKKQMR